MLVRGWSRLFGWAACVSLLCTLTAWLRLNRTLGASDAVGLEHPYAAWDLERQEPPSSDGQTCLIPRLHPFDPSVLSYLGTPKPIVCKNRQYTLTTVDDHGRLVFNASALVESGYQASRLNCQYSQLTRPDRDDFHVKYDSWKSLSPDGILLTSDFVAVRCYNFIGLTVYDYIHAHILDRAPNFTVPSKRNNAKTSSPPSLTEPTNVAFDKDFYSVFLFGVDSLSRLGVIRQLPKTYQYLTEEMGSYVFRGMTKVGDNTFPNLLAVLTGKSLEELSLGNKTKFYDSWPCLWKDFSDRGFATMFAEDQPHIGLFNYLRSGLRLQPTHHYMRPYWLAVESSTLHRLSSNMCFGGTPKHLLQLNYAERFIHRYTNVPSLGFSFLVELSHDYISRVTVADEDFQSWLQGLYQSGYLNKTVLVFFSDHGHRFDAIRATLMGRIEERMPFFAVYIPPSLLQAQPHILESVELNTGRLTSLFDAHATVRDVLELSNAKHKLGQMSTGKGVSLFGSVPLNRTCLDAGIPEHYCVCEEESPLPTDGLLALSSAKAVVQMLNQVLLEANVSAVCAALALKNIERVDELKLSHRVQVNSRISFGKHLEESSVKGMLSKLRVQIRTRPGDAEFEATVEYRADENTFTVLREVSRINKYGDQSWCVRDPEVRKFCYCSEQHKPL